LAVALWPRSSQHALVRLRGTQSTLQSVLAFERSLHESHSLRLHGAGHRRTYAHEPRDPLSGL